MKRLLLTAALLAASFAAQAEEYTTDVEQFRRAGIVVEAVRRTFPDGAAYILYAPKNSCAYHQGYAATAHGQTVTGCVLGIVPYHNALNVQFDATGEQRSLKLNQFQVLDNSRLQPLIYWDR